MKFYNETKHLYPETDASGIGLSATLLQTRDGVTCLKDTTPDNTILRPIVFASKRLTIAVQRYSDIERCKGAKCVTSKGAECYVTINVMILL